MTDDRTAFDDEVLRATAELRRLKGDADDAKAAYDGARHTVLARMEETGFDTWASEAGAATIVRGSKTSLDEAALLAELDPAAVAAITVTRVDLGKLEAAVELGLVEADAVVRHTTETPKAPYVRFAPKGPGR